MQSYHKFNEHQALERICERIEQEGEVALITDGGYAQLSQIPATSWSVLV